MARRLRRLAAGMAAGLCALLASCGTLAYAQSPATPDSAVAAALGRFLTAPRRVDTVLVPHTDTVFVSVPVIHTDTVVLRTIRVDTVLRVDTLVRHDTVVAAPAKPDTSPVVVVVPPPPASDSLYLATVPRYLARVRQGFEAVDSADGTTWGGNAQKVHGGGGDYYDRAASLFQFAALPEFADVAGTYRRRAAAIATDYGVGYLDPNKCGASPHWSQLDGVYRQWQMTRDTTAARRVRCTADILALAYGPAGTYISRTGGESRIAGRALLAQVLAWRVARDQGDTVAQKKYAGLRLAYLTRLEGWIQPDGSWPADNEVCGGQLNYMVAILSDALIQYASDDTTVLPRVRSLVLRSYTYIDATQRRPEGSLNYASVACPLNAKGNPVGGPTDTPDLSLFHPANLVWLAGQTGDAKWTAFADHLFADGTARGYWYGGKQFNELVQFGARYLVLRRGGA